uniref:Large ribosomal subunit protein uL11m n=1 Tax=Panagrolaimus superbus TaxID=310955 RepID=A0A914XYN5_9BILA
MASKVATRVRKKDIVKVLHGTLFKTNIKAQMATAAPPLGPQLGQRGLNVANFCKDFNKETGHIKPGAVLPTRVQIKPDRTYDLEICSPTSSWLLMRAAGIRRGRQYGGEIAGKLSVKHIYEIAKIKSRDKVLVGVPLKDICEMLIENCRKIGVKVQHDDLDPVEYKEFLDKRRETVAQQLQEWADKKAAKMLRTT